MKKIVSNAYVMLQVHKDCEAQKMAPLQTMTCTLDSLASALLADTQATQASNPSMLGSSHSTFVSEDDGSTPSMLGSTQSTFVSEDDGSTPNTQDGVEFCLD